MFRGTQDKSGSKVKQILCVALVGDYVYYLASTVNLSEFEARQRDIDQMFSSFSWGPPAKPQ